MNLQILDTVKKYGIQVNYKGFALCPFHNDNHPSLHVNVNKNLVFCNPCNLGLDPIGFMMKMENKTYGEIMDGLKNDEKPVKKSCNHRKLIMRAEKVLNDYVNFLYNNKDVNNLLYAYNVDYACYLLSLIEDGKISKDDKVRFILANVDMFKKISFFESIF